MEYTGEWIALGVAVSWTVTALCFEAAGRRIGAAALNIVRLLMAIGMLGVTLYVLTGTPVPWDAGRGAWCWLALSGLVGYVFGDYCLINSYLLIGSRFGQLFMTLAPPTAALTGFLFLDETLTAQALAGILICTGGIALSITGKKKGERLRIALPWRGVLFGIGAGVGQGLGLVLSKIGMNHWQWDAARSAVAGVAGFAVPFAATQIRAIAGVAGFLVLLALQRRGHDLAAAFRERKAMGLTALGAIFGPFAGVSFSLMAVQYTEAGIASTLMALTPVLILWPARIFFRERITGMQVAGAVISVAGVACFFL